MEFPHLLRLLAEHQFDTIYHEHFSYFSFTTVRRVFAAHGLTLFDVEELPTHGGSLRIYGRHAEEDGAVGRRGSAALLAREEAAGLLDPAAYPAFGERVHATKRKLLRFLLDARDARASRWRATARRPRGTRCSTTAASAPTFSTTRSTCSPHKQGRFLPGTRIPIHPPDRLRETRPDYVLILPWNLKDEIDRRRWPTSAIVGRAASSSPSRRLEVLE